MILRVLNIYYLRISPGSQSPTSNSIPRGNDEGLNNN